MTQQPSKCGLYSRIVDVACDRLAASDGRLDVAALHDHLDGLAKDDPRDVALRALADGCAYCLVSPNSRAVGACGPFAPMWVSRYDANGARVYPRHLEDVDDDTLRVWAGCAADASLHPLLRARLADLLWVRRHEPARGWFRIAVEAYVKLADTPAHIVEIEGGLRRAVDICAESNHSDLQSVPLAALQLLVERTLASDRDLYGVCWRAIRTLAVNGHRFSGLLDAGLSRYGSDPDRKSELLEIAIGASQEANEIKGLRLQQIAAYEAAADTCAGLLRVSHLDTARKIAAAGGLTEHENRLTAMIERTDMTHDWHTIEIPIEVDAEPMRSQAASIVGDDGLLPALARFSQFVPTGDPERSRTFVTELASQHPLLSLITRFEFGPEGGVARRPTDHDDRVAADLGLHDANAIMLFAGALGKWVLEALLDRHGPDLQPMLVDCFGNAPAIRAEQAEQIATSFNHWASGDSAAAGSVMASVVEPLVRGVCRQLAINVTRTDGQVRTLRSLLRALEPRLDPAQARYLEAALIDPRSLNLRNRAAHGLDPHPPHYQFVVLFHIACLLMCISYTSTSDTDRPEQ